MPGPPGHGKTLIGRRMQHVFGESCYHFEDCSKIHHTINLWGAPPPFHKSEQRPRFAEFLVQRSGKHAVVVLDEVEKMDRDVANSLLSVMQDGERTCCRQPVSPPACLLLSRT
jgi:ATP-dependent Clp protease ATP-binding subunit ClpA